MSALDLMLDQSGPGPGTTLSGSQGFSTTSPAKSTSSPSGSTATIRQQRSHERYSDGQSLHRRDTFSAFGHGHDGSDLGKGDQRKRMSLPGVLLNPVSEWDTVGEDGSVIVNGGGVGGSEASPKKGFGSGKGKEIEEGMGEEGDGKKKRATSINSGLTSCEACRRGKRRCEPSPLVSPSHPDAAKLPCARCRRFALECVRVKVQRRKGPAPVDLSLLSDAVHGFGNGTGSGSGAGTAGGDGAGWLNGDMKGMAVVPLVHASGGSGLQHTGPHPSYPILAASPSTFTPDNLDHVVHPSVVTTIIDLFFDYVYPLTPCLHRPTFLAQLAARHDRTDPIFFALVLTILASTLVQVPRSLVNLDKNEVENLVRRCVKVARAKIGFIFEESVPVQISFIVISYLEGIVHLLMGNNTAHVMCTANAIQLALAMRLNEETSYEGLNPIESEIRRRTYWLLFQADKSAACMRARTINLRLEDAASLRLPAEVDDEMITLSGIAMQPAGRTPIIAGFNIVTNLFRILNDALLLQRRKAPPTVDSILADLQNVNELREKTLQVTRDVASPLRLNKTMDSRAASPADDWEAQLEARFLNFFDSAGDEQHTLNSFLVLQGNILVTQSVVRLVLLHSKEALLQQLAVITQMPVQGIGSLAGMQASEPAEDIACELLDGLNSLPVECVATNGPSLVQKVRFVAIQLMECSVSSSPTTMRAQKLLMQFLSVLSVIEGMYTFGRDISAE